MSRFHLPQIKIFILIIIVSLMRNIPILIVQIRLLYKSIHLIKKQIRRNRRI